MELSEKMSGRAGLYRLPWTRVDNAAAWLEVTTTCNLACEGCYRQNTRQNKTLDELSQDLDTLEAARTFDGLSIAGGEAILHPQIVDIVRMVADRGWKPAILSNGVALTKELLVQLRDAGLYKVTIHVDSKQSRPGWKGASEEKLNELRLQLAELVDGVGGISCNFNATVYSDTLDQVPALVKWAQEHADIGGGFTFVLFRTSDPATFDHFDVRGKKIGPEDIPFNTPVHLAGVRTEHVVEKIREVAPGYQLSAYLNGTEDPDSLKWAIAGQLVTRRGIQGYVGPRTMEMAQVLYHLKTGRYLAYRKPSRLGPWAWLPLAALFDGGARRALGRHLLSLLRGRFSKLYFQTIDVLQPIDYLPDGRQNMCDGCPDMIPWRGRLVWSCRLDECLRFGGMMTTRPASHRVEGCAVTPPPLPEC